MVATVLASGYAEVKTRLAPFERRDALVLTHKVLEDRLSLGAYVWAHAREIRDADNAYDIASA